MRHTKHVFEFYLQFILAHKPTAVDASSARRIPPVL
ncbi:hypothetical protein RSAG8_11239, partial [Rhizoctonia solani AG-8 WAC10335]